MVMERLPAYITYSAWLRLLQGLESYLPPRLDKSYFDSLKFSDSLRLTARGTLLFLGLLSSKEEPTDRLKQMVESRGEQRKRILKTVIEEAYRPVLRDLDLERATLGQLADRFKEAGAKGDIGRKCLSIFLMLASDAGISLSPSLSAKLRTGGKARAIGQHRAPRRAIKAAIKTGRDEDQPSEKELPGYDELRRMYILKLIQQVPMANTGGKDASAIKAEADMRKEELDRIERLLGLWSVATKREQVESER